MSGPGYVDLVGRETEHGAWAKVGVAARIGRVLDHQGWTMLVRTFEADYVLANPHSLERSILEQFRDEGPRSAECAVCGAPKPPVGRTDVDGLTEVRHLRCYPGMRDFFEQAWRGAPRLAQDAVWRVDFDPLSLHLGGFVPVGQPWRQLPRMDPSEYQANTCNVLCVRDVPAGDMLKLYLYGY